ncbi:MAG: aminotransferase class V-fold PLP-dependent enzyme [Candidatus Eisenbacteria bacterium]|uniref:Aminotransferase class V-fold PLP-dependent enzyme n=1 Tax=Eiseniibacteriota bacterium TaxID=2212470 RepID=A0A849SHV6_UNCEI|nr:aminotransferase class V-fold PLP-dependent enzyme [Candidatus Eisenbacteria bacterium]
MRELWPLEPDALYLNHGTVGVTPKRVLAVQQAIRDEIERHPARFLLRELADLRMGPMRAPARMRVAAAQVAEFVGVPGDELMFVDNATTGVNAVLRSFDFDAGDEIVVTDHGYGAVNLTAAYVASRTGAVVRTATLPEPRWEADDIADTISGAFNEHTRLVVVDHVSAESAAIFPIRAIASRAHAVGAAVLVDGAHAPGMIPLDLDAFGVDWYVGNLHKWAMSPRSSAILWAAPERRASLHPTTISWGLGKGLDAEFDLVGTRDPSPWLASPAGIEFIRDLGFEAMCRYNHALVWSATRMMCDRWNVPLPGDESLFGNMVTIPLPERFGTTPQAGARLKDALLYEERIESRPFGWRGRVYLRLAAQVYNELADFERLAVALEKHL